MVVIIFLGFSCDKNESVVKVDGRCGSTKAKFIRNWCASDYGAVIDILSNDSLGEDWSEIPGKTYHHAVLVGINSTLSKDDGFIGKVMNPSDSIFYFDYQLMELNACKMCCAPRQEMLITLLASHPCSTNNN